jgi:hypothetical protein
MYDLFPLVIGLVVFLGAVFVLTLGRPRFGSSYRAEMAARMYNAATHASYRRKRVMNRGEYRVFAVLEKAVQGRGYRVLAQTSLGELLETSDRKAFAAINSKRADIAVIDHRGFAVAVFEVQGAGHSLRNDARLRDMTKRAALESAGVALVELTGSESEQEIISRFRYTLASAYENRVSAPAVQNGSPRAAI